MAGTQRSHRLYVRHVGMQVAGGISGFKAEPVRMLMVSSAAVERNAIIGDNAGW